MKRTSSPCSRFHFSVKAGRTALSIASFMTEKP
jgi:hypothetical protein